MTWWLDATPDWDAGEPRRALELLVHAYDERPAIEAVARAAGLVWRSLPVEATAAQVWRTVLDDAVRAGLLYNLFTTALADGSVAMFHHLLRVIVGEARLEALDEPPPAALQAVTDPRAGLRDPREREQVLADARRRTALIEVNGVPAGTGFLIGPDLVMTAAHVVDLNCPPDPAKQVTAVFDRYAGSTAPAESGVRVRAIAWIAGRPPTQAEREARYHEWNASATSLDYAIYRLEHAIGGEPALDDVLRRPRGFYVPSDADYDFQAGGDLTIHQHPLGGSQAMTTVRGAFAINANRTRVRYQGNTTAGSSGSACIDDRGRLVALHHFAAPQRNQGVPIRAIALDLVAQQMQWLLAPPPPARSPVVGPPPPLGRPAHAAAAPERGAAAPAQPNPFSTLTFGRKPFVNRQNLRELVESMFGASGRVLVIEGSSGAGKSYSFQFLTHLAAEHRHCHELQVLASQGVMSHKLDLDRYASAPTDGLRQSLIDDILLMLGAVAPGADPLAQAARSLAGLSTWLPTWLCNKGVLHWLFIDNLDRFALERDGVKDLIATLSNMVEENYAIPLRLVLVVGERGPQLQKELARWAQRDTVSSLTPAEAERWLSRSLAARGIAVAATVVHDRVTWLHQGSVGNPETLAIELAAALDELATTSAVMPATSTAVPRGGS